MASSKKQKSSYSVHKLSQRLVGGVWLFPAVLTVILLGLTALRISGSSVGIYHDLFYGEQAKDPDLLFNNPNPIRSDEWLVNTQLTIAQAADNYPRINENIGNGLDMSIGVDVPYKGWSVLFKPQNLAFFVLPFEYAFAFKWWFLLVLLIIAGYFFTLRFFPNKRLLAAILATGFAFSPFIFWWYLTGTLAPLVWGFFSLLLSMRIINGEPVPFLKRYPKKYSYILQALLLAYVLSCFAVVLYPPYQIPIAVAVTTFMIGFLLQKYSSGMSVKSLLKRVGALAASAVLALAVVLAFIATRSEAISTLANTVYPGRRIEKSGTLDYHYVLTSYLQPQLQRDSKAGFYYNNPSEASNFILIMPFLLVPGFFIIGYELKKKKRVDWVLMSLQLACLLLIMRVFLPFGEPFYRLLFLDKVPNERLIIGIGFLGFIQMLYIMKKVADVKIKKGLKYSLVAAYGLVCFGLLLALGLWVKEMHPGFINSVPLIAVGAFVVTLITVLVLLKKRLVVAAIFCGFSFISVVRVHPLYHGLGPILNNSVSQEIKAVSAEENTWVTIDNIYYENFGLINDRDSITGVQFYPDLNLWRQIDNGKYEDIYNRYAHILFSSNPELPEKLQAPYPDTILVKFECSDFVKRNVRFTLSTHKVQSACLKEVDVIEYPNVKFHINAVIAND